MPSAPRNRQIAAYRSTAKLLSDKTNELVTDFAKSIKNLKKSDSRLSLAEDELAQAHALISRLKPDLKQAMDRNQSLAISLAECQARSTEMSNDYRKCNKSLTSLERRFVELEEKHENRVTELSNLLILAETKAIGQAKNCDEITAQVEKAKLENERLQLELKEQQFEHLKTLREKDSLLVKYQRANGANTSRSSMSELEMKQAEVVENLKKQVVDLRRKLATKNK